MNVRTLEIVDACINFVDIYTHRRMASSLSLSQFKVFEVFAQHFKRVKLRIKWLLYSVLHVIVRIVVCV